LPLSGFYNPAHHREIDLLPVDDVRYRYFLFPLNFGLPEDQALKHHARMRGAWKEISRNQVALLKSSTPFLRPVRENYDSGMPRRMASAAQITFDPVWYAHEYLDAAMEISEGWFEDPLHHYLEVGRLRGYQPIRPLDRPGRIDPTLENLALNRSATQSSTSMWSRGATPGEDAVMAVNGRPWESDGFHTDHDERPWWEVDLGETCAISAVRIFNRDRQPDHIRARAAPLLVECSDDRVQWVPLFRTEPDQTFGGFSDGLPLAWSGEQSVQGRYVRISLLRPDYLHLCEVEVYGTRGVAPMT
jgi:hypothetical protein